MSQEKEIYRKVYRLEMTLITITHNHHSFDGISNLKSFTNLSFHLCPSSYNGEGKGKRVGEIFGGKLRKSTGWGNGLREKKRFHSHFEQTHSFSIDSLHKFPQCLETVQEQ